MVIKRDGFGVLSKVLKKLLIDIDLRSNPIRPESLLNNWIIKKGQEFGQLVIFDHQSQKLTFFPRKLIVQSAVLSDGQKELVQVFHPICMVRFVN